MSKYFPLEYLGIQPSTLAKFAERADEKITHFPWGTRGLKLLSDSLCDKKLFRFFLTNMYLDISIP